MGRKRHFGQEITEGSITQLENEINQLKEKKIDPETTQAIKDKVEAEIAQAKKNLETIITTIYKKKLKNAKDDEKVDQLKQEYYEYTDTKGISKSITAELLISLFNSASKDASVSPDIICILIFFTSRSESNSPEFLQSLNAEVAMK